MPQFISGREIAQIKESEHTTKIQNLKKRGIVPKLAIIQTISSSVIDMYVRVKKAYADQVGILVEHYNTEPRFVTETIEKLNEDSGIHGIIIQLPLHESLDVEQVLNSVVKEKDVDGLVQDSFFIPPTVQAIIWLMDAYISELSTKKIALVGKGKLVGKPLEKELSKLGTTPKVFIKNDNLENLTNYEVIVSATGVPNLLKNEYIPEGAYVLDAGTAEENGAIHGDVADEVYDRNDIYVTPIKGGVGVLTVRALFENVLKAADKSVENR